MQTARNPWPTASAAAVVGILFLLAQSVLAAPEPDTPTGRPFPQGRVLGTSYFGPALDWQNPTVRSQILVADYLVLGDVLARSDQYDGFVDAMHEAKPTIKILHTFIVPWIFDVCNSPNPPGRRPCEELGRRIYDRCYPQDIAHMVPANPNPAVRDTAFMTYGTYMIDFDNPNVARDIADIFYQFVMEGNNPDIDGVNLDFFQANWDGWAMYGNSPGELGYTGNGNTYCIDMDRDGIPANQDADERTKTRDAYGVFVSRLRERFGADFILDGNGPDVLSDAAMSNGQQFYDLLDIRQRELFPWYWSPNDYFLPAFDIEPNGSYGGQNVWELANHGHRHPSIPTPQGSYLLVDTLNGPNGPWICLVAMMLDNGMAYIGGNNMDEGRTDWWTGDPMPLLDNLGAATAPAVRTDRTWSRQFAHGSIFMEFTNSPAELYIEPYQHGRINAPDGPFKYLVLGATAADTLYRGGGWPRAAATNPPVLVHRADFENSGWISAFGGGNNSVARVGNYPHGGARALRGNLKPGLTDPIAAVNGNSDPVLQYDAGGLLGGLTGDAYLRYWWRWDGFTWNGSATACGVTASLVDATTGQPALSLAMGYLPAPGRGGATGGQLDIQLSSAFSAWGQQNWGASVARLGDLGSATLLPLDGDWHQIEIMVRASDRKLLVWVDGDRLGARAGDANAQAHYPDGCVPLPPTFRWSALRFASANANQLNLSVDGTGYAVGYQLDDVELHTGYSPSPGRPGRPVVVGP